MRTRYIRAIAALIAALAVAACSGGSPGATGTGTPVPAATDATAATLAPAATQSPLPIGAEATASPSADSAFDVCSLLTDAEASAVTGVSTSSGDGPTSPGAVECQWNSAVGILTLSVMLEPDAATAKALYSAALTNARSMTVESLPNFADGAFIARLLQAYGSSQMSVVAGTTFFTIATLNGTPPSDTQFQDAATLVMGRLP
jgi:Protein of unknown function (DUF3558)